MKTPCVWAFIVLGLFSSALAFADDPAAQCSPAPQADPAAQGGPATQSDKELKRSPWWAGFFMAGVGAGVTQETRTPQEWGEGAAG
jgi:hypothetical protein